MTNNIAYTIYSPYKSKLIRPEKVTILSNDNGFYLFEEYLPINYSEEFDYYGVLVSEHLVFNNELDAYKALVNELMYEVKQFNSKIQL